MPRGLLVAALLLFPTDALAGQSVVWAAYGHNSDHATGLAAAENLSLGYLLARGSAGVAATVGLPTDATVNTRWATAVGWMSRPVGPTRWDVNGGASVFLFDDRVIDGTGAGSTLWLELERPLLLAPVELRARVGGRHGWHARAGHSTARPLGRAGLASAVRTGPLVASAAIDHWRAEEGGYSQLGARLGLHEPRVQAWGALAHWLDRDLPGTGWELGTRLGLTDRLAVIARGGVQATDILFWIPRQRTWSVGVQVRTGTGVTVAAVPVPVMRDGRRAITLALPGEAHREPPAVAGSFSDWQPILMERGDGRWEIELVLEPGVHEYAFVTADGEWFVPEDTPGRKPDGFGGHVAVVIVQ